MSMLCSNWFMVSVRRGFIDAFGKIIWTQETRTALSYRLALLLRFVLDFYTSCSDMSQKLPQKFSKVAQKLLI